MPEAPKPAMMNTIIIFDVYCVAGECDTAQLAVLELIRTGEISPSHMKALPMASSPVRKEWQDERPIVAGDVPDEVFEQLKGKTTQQAYDLLTKRQR